MFNCDVCGTNKLSMYSQNNEILFDADNLKLCQLGSHPIPQPQIEVVPDRVSCVHCLEDKEMSQDIPDLKPRLMNSVPCPTCKTLFTRDPDKYSHRKGRTEVRLINEDGSPYICCTLHDYMKKGSCRYSRKLREDDEIEYIELNRGLNLKLFIDEIGADLDTQSISDLVEIENIEHLVEKIEYKLEEINELLKKLRDLTERKS